jgi:hypothetical protein
MHLYFHLCTWTWLFTIGPSFLKFSYLICHNYKCYIISNVLFQGIKQNLSELVPDLLLKELPDKYFMDQDKIELVESKENCLGTGVTGSVFKGIVLFFERTVGLSLI